MEFQRIHKSSARNPQTQVQNSQFAPSSVRSRSPQNSHGSPTPAQIANADFKQNNFEAFGLQLKQQYGSITPVEIERLGVLQAKIDDFSDRQLEAAKAQPNLLEILVRNAQKTQTTKPDATVRPKLTIRQPNDKYEREADRVASQVIAQSHDPVPPHRAEIERSPLQQQHFSPKHQASVGIQRKLNFSSKDLEKAKISGGFWYATELQNKIDSYHKYYRGRYDITHTTKLLDEIAEAADLFLIEEEKAKKQNPWMETDYARRTHQVLDLLFKVEVEKKAVEQDAIPYDYVFIGAGATTAYYIEENQQELKDKKVLIIGPDQPWSKERGPGNINHPMSQIVPGRSPEKDKGLAPRTGEGSFTEWVNTVLKKAERKEDKVSKKPKLSDDNYYWIGFENDQHPVKAKNVILAIGIGPHDKPKNYDKIDANSKGLQINDDNKITLPRVMSLDEFQVSIPILKTTFTEFKKNNNDKKPVMILAGPNAGIDAATTYARELQDFAELKWIAKGLDDIPFLKGTDNAKGQELAGKLGNNLITDRFKHVEIKSNKVVAVTGNNEATNNNIEGDLLIYALGPDPKFLDKFLPEGQDAKGLEPIYDRNNRINSAHDRVDSGNELDLSSNVEERIKSWADRRLKTLNSTINKQQLDNKIKDIANLYNKLTTKTNNTPAPDFGRKSRPKESMETSVVGLQVPKQENAPSFQILGSSAVRLATNVSYKYHSESICRIIDEANSKQVKNTELINLAQEIWKGILRIEPLAEAVFTLLVSRDKAEQDRGKQKSKELDTESTNLKKIQQELKNKLENELQNPPENGSNNKPQSHAEKRKQKQRQAKYQTANILSPLPRYVSSLISSIEGFDAKNNPSNPFKAATHMNEIASTHPINVALGDQLTSVLGQIDVVSEQQQKSTNYNLTINDATTIADFIALNYSDIPPVVANGIVRHIIWDRRYGPGAQTAVPAYDINADKADTTSQFNYQEQWKFKLQALNGLSKSIFNI